MNLQPIKLAHADPYLVYWLAHLVPIYHRRAEDSLDIYEHNYRLREYLPSFPMEQVIHLGLTVHTGTTRVKNMIERLL